MGKCCVNKVQYQLVNGIPSELGAAPSCYIGSWGTPSGDSLNLETNAYTINGSTITFGIPWTTGPIDPGWDAAWEAQILTDFGLTVTVTVVDLGGGDGTIQVDGVVSPNIINSLTLFDIVSFAQVPVTFAPCP